MVKQKILAIVCAIALGVLPTFAVAQDSSLEQGSLARTGTGLAQVPTQEADPNCLIPDEEAEDGCALNAAEGGIVAAVVAGAAICAAACSSGGGGTTSTTTTTTTTTTSTP